MKRWLSMLVAVVTFSSATYATTMEDLEAQVEAQHAALVEVETMMFPELELHDVLTRLSKTKHVSEGLGDYMRLSTMAVASVDAQLVPYMEAFKPLYIALTEPLEAYLVALKAYQRSRPQAVLLKVVDLEATMVDCEDCPTRCASCKGTKKCKTCKGQGFFTERSESALGANTRRTCSACAGTKVCKACQSSSTLCLTCKGRGRVMDEALRYERLLQWVKMTLEVSMQSSAEALRAREQTLALAADLRAVRSPAYYPTKLLEALDALPEERQYAKTWSQVVALRECVVKLCDEKAFMAPEKVWMREEIARSIELAQSKSTAEASLLALLLPLERCEASELYATLQTVVEGYVQQWCRECEQQVVVLREDFAMISAEEEMEQRVRRLEDFIERCEVKPMARRLRETSALALLHTTEANAQAAVSALKTEAMAALEVAKEEMAKAAEVPPVEEPANLWWLWPAIIGGCLIVAYFIFSAIQMVGEQQKKKAKEAQRQATLESIRQTFARSKKHR